jgi:hypothetical protein
MRPVAEQYKVPLNRREIPQKPSQHRSSDAGLDQKLENATSQGLSPPHRQYQYYRDKAMVSPTDRRQLSWSLIALKLLLLYGILISEDY